MYTGKLIKIDSNHNNLRSSIIDGWFEVLPLKGVGFLFYSTSLDPSKVYRLVATTEIVELENVFRDQILFKTKNSTYLLSYTK